MDTAAELIVSLGVGVVVGVLAWVLLTSRDPEDAASHEDRRRETRSEELYGNAFGPAGPDAESQRPDEVGASWPTRLPPQPPSAVPPPPPPPRTR
jgi:hypothetical protein